jgi:hypothetical protein
MMKNVVENERDGKKHIANQEKKPPKNQEKK